MRQVLSTGIDVLSAGIDRFGRKMSRVITSVSLVSVVPAVFGGMGWCAVSDWSERAAREPASVAPSPRHPRRYNRHRHASGGADRIAGGGNRHT